MSFRMIVGLLVATSVIVITSALTIAELAGPPHPVTPADALQASAQRPRNEIPFALIRKKAEFARSGLTPAEAYDIGYEFARNSFAVTVMHAGDVNDDSMRQLGNELGDRQLEWQAGGGKGIVEQRLVASLNQHLELNDAPEYLKIRPREMRLMRLEVWIRVPELSTGVERRLASSGRAIFDQRMSPFEAYLVSDLLLHQKRFNSDYVRTEAENARLNGRPTPPRKAGLYVMPPNPRGLEFHRHIASLAEKKWHTAEAVIQTVTDILDESEQ